MTARPTPVWLLPLDGVIIFDVWHPYCPASDCSTFDSTKYWPLCTSLPFLYQLRAVVPGDGIASTSHVKFTDVFSCTDTCPSLTVMFLPANTATGCSRGPSETHSQSSLPEEQPQDWTSCKRDQCLHEVGRYGLGRFLMHFHALPIWNWSQNT